jgi:uncharacterized coiled-coil protein SlyX
MFAAACGPTPDQQQQLAELPNVIAEKERLQGEVERLTLEMSEIEAQLATRAIVRAPDVEEAVRPSTPAAVGRLVAHVGEVEQELTAAGTRLRSLNATSATQVQRIQALEASIAEERAAMEGQRERIAALQTAITGLEEETARQGETNLRLVQTVDQMTDEANTVWYVVGTKEELLERGIVRQEGGSRVLFIFGKRGQTLVPSRDVDPSVFTTGDLRVVTSIPLPDAEVDTKWTVVTPQDLSAAQSTLDDKGRVVGDALSIVDPARFWANSRYLIVVRS